MSPHGTSFKRRKKNKVSENIDFKRTLTFWKLKIVCIIQYKDVTIVLYNIHICNYSPSLTVLSTWHYKYSFGGLYIILFCRNFHDNAAFQNDISARPINARHTATGGVPVLKRRSRWGHDASAVVVADMPPVPWGMCFVYTPHAGLHDTSLDDNRQWVGCRALNPNPPEYLPEIKIFLDMFCIIFTISLLSQKKKTKFFFKYFWEVQ